MVRDEQDSVLDGHAEDRHEADGGRDAEVRAREVKDPDASHGRFQNVDQNEHAILHRAEHRVQEDHDHAQREGDDPQEACVGLLHLLELSGPLDAVTLLGKSSAGVRIVDLALGFVDGRLEVAAPDAELDRYEPAIVLAIDVRGSRLVGCDLGQLQERDSVARVIAAAGNVNQDALDHQWVVALARRQAQDDIEKLLALDHLGEGLAADGHAHDLFDVGDAHAVARTELAIDLDFEVGLTHDVEHAHVLDSRDGFQDLDDALTRFLEDFQVVAVDLDRVGSLDSGERFLDVVAD